MSDHEKPGPGNFIRTIISEDLAGGKHQRVVTRFPPEPNGYLHLGHAKSICLNFGIAREFTDKMTPARCHLRFDDTNPSTEEAAYVEAIREDVLWLGFDWGEHLYFASDYFTTLYEYAEHLIKNDQAYVCDLSAEEIRATRGTLTTAGRDSPFRHRSRTENLDLFRQMRAGAFADGTRVLRAKIDMAAANLNLRDPVLYRIIHRRHHRSGDKWCIYPMYDYAHPISDAHEHITHSLCTLEFADHRPLYDWFLANLPVPCRPRQIEFARLNLGYTVLSKRKLQQLVNEGCVSGWDDPRMPTLAAVRRRGYPAAAIRNFCDKIGVAKKESLVDLSLIEHCVREDLNENAVRVMGILNPLKVIINNYPTGQSEELIAQNHPQKPEMGTRLLPFGREIYIEREDFMAEPVKNFFRLAPGQEVRLRYAYFIKCREVIKDEQGEIIGIICSYDPATIGGKAPDGRRVKGTIHWVAADRAITAELRLYDRLFTVENPEKAAAAGAVLKDFINPESRVTLQGCRLEPSLADARLDQHYQFERQGYFCLDRQDSQPQHPVFNRTITLRDTWEKIKAR